MVLNSRNPLSTLYEQLCGFEGEIPDHDIWEIIDTLKSDSNDIDIVRAVLMSGAQTPESACRMLFLFKFDMELLSLAMQSYYDSMEFRMKIIPMLEAHQPIKAKWVESQYNTGEYLHAVNC